MIYDEECITNLGNVSVGNVIKRYIDNTNKALFIITPFISNNTLLKLLKDINTREVSIITSWNAEYLSSGFSSLSLYPLCKERGWTLYINSHLHAKIYSDSFDTCIITSANCTNKALFDNDGNIECYAIHKLNNRNKIELNRLLIESTLVNDDVFKTISKQIVLNGDCIEIGEIVIDQHSPYYITQLPAFYSPLKLWDYINNPYNTDESNRINHDIALYAHDSYNSRESFYNNVKENFINHPFIQLIDNNISDKGLHFGKMSQIIHQTCLDVPTPYRKDVKNIVQNIFRWFVELFPDLYFIDIPYNHSEAIFKYE